MESESPFNVSLFFTEMCDELKLMSETDDELADGLKWIDDEAKKLGVSFYEMIFITLHKDDIKMKAEEWMKTRN